ncbi:E3 ubiquitin ligase PARAQUAT TOLERANCE 3-like [Mercurialis annua]|uniref:E3 ubiquitin ligase PARAQUAT TOLERANCE 3-like n=1 Tax=Mercurialis annua TaxID=3986 RepID=UPI00215E19E7|nr:E3 ubiquitin ligase PARAQUAT TOLERANCE 3-like [Mercurialis annua]
MGIRYKFASAKDFNEISIIGNFVTVSEFKKKVYESQYKSKKNDKYATKNGLCLGTDLDFIVTNAQTNEPYDNDSCLIPNHTYVLLRRIPGNRRRQVIDTSTIMLLERQIPLSSRKNLASTNVENSGSGLSSSSTVTSVSLAKSSQNSGFLCNDVLGNGTNRVAEFDGADDEDSRIKSLINTPAMDWRGVEGGGSYARIGSGLEMKTPHEGYVCRRCNVSGHFIQHCPTNGDPSYDFKRMMKNVAAPVLQQSEAAFDMEVGGLPTTKKRSWCASDVPAEFLCSLCKQVMKDAVLTSKCCFNSFCDKCIRDHLMNSKLNCVCGATQILTDSLIPNLTLRETINRILASGISSSSSSGNSKVSSVVQSAAELPECGKKPLPVSMRDVGNKRKLCDASQSTNDISVATVGSMRLEEATSRGSSLQAEELQQKAGSAVEVQQKAVSGEKAKKKRKTRNTEDVAAESYTMPNASYGYSPHWVGYNPYYYSGGGYNPFCSPFGM